MTDPVTIKLYAKQRTALIFLVICEVLSGAGITLFAPELHVLYVIQSLIVTTALCFAMFKQNKYGLSLEISEDELRSIVAKQQILLEKQNDTIEMQRSHLDELRSRDIPFPFHGVN